MAAKLVLQINNLEALERLIGGDSQIEIDVRQSIVDAFATKYLKPLAEKNMEKTVNKLLVPLDFMVKSKLNEVFVAPFGHRLRTEYEEKLKLVIDEWIVRAAKDQLSDSVVSATNEINQYGKQLLLEFRAKMDTILAEQTLEKMAEKIAQEKLKKMLESMNENK